MPNIIYVNLNHNSNTQLAYIKYTLTFSLSAPALDVLIISPSPAGLNDEGTVTVMTFPLLHSIKNSFKLVLWY